MDGRGFCEARQQDKNLAGIPVVILSGADDVAEQAIALGAATYLRKPVDPVKFLHTLRECGVRQESSDAAAHQDPGASKPEDDSTWSS
jgi:CheY-like chemotaxis protein